MLELVKQKWRQRTLQACTGLHIKPIYTNKLETGMLFTLLQLKVAMEKIDSISLALETLIIYTFVHERLTGAPHLCFSRGKEGST